MDFDRPVALARACEQMHHPVTGRVRRRRARPYEVDANQFAVEREVGHLWAQTSRKPA
jgi:hypothetical protein